MKIFDKIKKIILKCDLFCTTEFFRYDEEPEYRTYTGALCSITIVLFFITVFTNVILITLSKSEIIWSMNSVD